mgnify:CR=1 FL=1
MKIERRQVLFGGLAAMCAGESQASSTQPESRRPVNVRIAGVMTKDRGLVGTEWSDIKPGDVVIASDWDIRGCLMNQFAFRALSAPESRTLEGKLECEMISLEEAWGRHPEPLGKSFGSSQ